MRAATVDVARNLLKSILALSDT